jgi:hypothetical protein
MKCVTWGLKEMTDQNSKIDSDELPKIAENANEPASSTPKEHPGIALFMALRGLGAGIYDSAGGGEAWLAAERAQFYGPEKKQLR